MSYIESTEAVCERIELDGWVRRDHFDFFSDYDNPFFSITSEVNCDGLLARCRERSLSKTFSLWHGVLRAANEVAEFRYRIDGAGPVLYQAVHLSPTVLRPDDTFTITFVPYRRDLDEFCALAREIVDEARATTGFKLDNKTRRIDLVHFSTVPWFRFTGVTHARAKGAPQSEPKITIGRYGPGRDGATTIPVSITAHHGLVDGVHVGRFLDRLEELWR